MAQSVFSSITVFGVHPDVPVRAFFMPKAKQTAHVSAHSTVHNISSIRQNGPYRQNFMRHPLSISWCTLTAYHFLSNTGNFLVCSRSFWFPLPQRKKEPKGSFFFGQIGNVLSKRCLSKVILHAQNQHRFLRMELVFRFIINFVHMLLEYILSDFPVHVGRHAAASHPAWRRRSFPG